MRVITTHTNTDFDGMASMIAAQKLYPDGVLVFPGSQEKAVRDFIAQTLLYRYQFLKAKQIEPSRVTSLVVVDTRSSQRLGSLDACLQNTDLELIVFDHHPKADGDLVGTSEVIRDVGSTMTLLAEILQQQGIEISSEEATIFTLGIYEDTGSLTYTTTTPDDLRAAAWLLECGAKLDVVTQFISHDLTSHQIGYLNDLMKNAKRVTVQDLEIVIATLSLPIYVDDFSLIVQRLVNMENLDVLFAIVAMAGRTYLIGRSRIPDVNVGAIARDFGGGGHASASSATLTDIGPIEAYDQLIRSLQRHVRPQAIAREMMTSPAISVADDATLYEAQALMTRYNINAMPVVPRRSARQEGSEPIICGIISRQMVERAVSHELGNQPVQDYMASDIEVLSLNATLADIQEIIIEHRQRLIPIVHDRDIKGIITRTDLLNRLVNEPANLPKNLLHEAEHPSLERSRNLSHLMSGCLSSPIVELLQTIGTIADQFLFNAFVVGGFVRDLLLRKANIDLDIVVEGDGIAFARKLSQHLGGRVREHERFGTATIILPQDLKIDIATARLEYYEYPAALPTVELSSIKLDLYRRDFTINAMAIQLNPEHFGRLVDFFNSQNDLKQMAIKVLHNLSFVDDPTRIFRAVRFEKRMDFTIARHTERLIRNAVKMNLFGKADDPRFFTELKLLLNEENASPALERLAELGLFPFLWPDLKPHLAIDRRFRHCLVQTQRSIAWFKLLYLADRYEPWIVYLLTIMSRSPMAVLANFCDRFQLPQRNRTMLLSEKQLADNASHHLSARSELKNSDIFVAFRELHIEGLLYLMAVARKTEVKKAVSAYVTTLRHQASLLNGDDLKQLGYRPGPPFKKMLEALLLARLDGLTSTRDDEIAFLNDHFPLSDGH